MILWRLNWHEVKPVPSCRMSEIIAHRGASLDAPENTSAAFRLAWEQGATGVELDVRLSKDGCIMVIHDEDLRRTTGSVDLVKNRNAKALQQLDAGSWKSTRWTGQKIPLLEEVLAEVPSEHRVYIEIKTGIEILSEMERVLEASPLTPDQMSLIGFDYEVMNIVNQQLTPCEVGWTIDRPWKAPRWEKVLEKAVTASFTSLNFSHEWPLTSAMILEVHDAGLKVNVWTVDDPRRAKRFIELGVDGIMTNAPGLILRYLANTP
jgi:glycerophosphoryl diester phosphodiesterase